MTVEVKAGDWIVYFSESFAGHLHFNKSQVEKVTDKQARLARNAGYAKIIKPDAILVALNDEAAIDKILQSINGAYGQYSQQWTKAKTACSEAINTARARLDATIAKLIQTDAIEKERG